MRTAVELARHRLARALARRPQQQGGGRQEAPGGVGVRPQQQPVARRTGNREENIYDVYFSPLYTVKVKLMAMD